MTEETNAPETTGETPVDEVTATPGEVENLVVAGNAIRRPRVRKTAKLAPEAVEADADHDGFIDVDPADAERLITDLIALDVVLREHNSSVAELVRSVASAQLGVRV